MSKMGTLLAALVAVVAITQPIQAQGGSGDITARVGQCPVLNALICLPLSKQLTNCTQDSDCPGTQKCCEICGGNKQCYDKNLAVVGQCPVDNKQGALCVNAGLDGSMANCTSNADCNGNDGEVCCSMCGSNEKHCVSPSIITIRPGQCAAATHCQGKQTKNDDCQTDQDCAVSDKCCDTCTGKKCQAPLVDLRIGQCPQLKISTLLCLPLSSARTYCNVDDDCFKDEKCCATCNKTAKQCYQNNLVAVQEQCPAARVGPVCLVPPQGNNCTTDAECTGNDKCCEFCQGQGPYCSLPDLIFIQLGMCPIFEIKYLGCHSHHSSASGKKCKTSKDCSGNDTCCQTCNGQQCTMGHTTPTELLNQCPAATTCPTSNTTTCKDDTECTGSKMCCDTCNGKQCVATDIVAVKVGFCPMVKVGELCLSVPTNGTSCTTDMSCPDDQKCCQTCNGQYCAPPNIAEVKVGKCPLVTVDLLQPKCKQVKRPIQCKADGYCDGVNKCCTDSCGYNRCTNPLLDIGGVSLPGGVPTLPAGVPSIPAGVPSVPVGVPSVPAGIPTIIPL